MEAACTSIEIGRKEGVAGGLLLYRVVKVSEKISRVYRHRDDAWRVYVTLELASNTAEESTTDREQRRHCVTVKRRSIEEAKDVQSYYQIACELHRLVEHPESRITGRRTGLCSIEATFSKPESDEAREGIADALDLMADPKTVHCTVNSKRTHECVDRHPNKPLKIPKESYADIDTSGTFKSSMMPIKVSGKMRMRQIRVMDAESKWKDACVRTRINH